MKFDRQQWNALILDVSHGHLLQTWDWGQTKAAAGWRVSPRVWEMPTGEPAAAALLLSRRLKYGPLDTHLDVAYVPRGPLLDWSVPERVDQVLAGLEDAARRKGVVFVKIDPELVIGAGVPGQDDAVDDPVGLALLQRMRQRGWRYAADQVQFRNTVLIDLGGTEDDWLARMKQKTRYNLRLAMRKGVVVRRGTLEDLPLMYRMYAATADRDGFIIRQKEYYFDVWQRFYENNMAVFLIAEVESHPVAALVLFHFGARAWYLYGMSTQEHREAMPTYLLQWEAMRVARDAGCTVYDLWGAPDEFNEEDPLWGVYRFKLGWGGAVVRTSGAWDYTNKPLLYRLYATIIPRILAVMRFWRRRETRQEVAL